MSDTGNVSLEHKRLWLTIEGWKAYKGLSPKGVCTFSQDGKTGYFWSTYRRKMRGYEVGDTEIVWDLDRIPDHEIEGMYAMAAEGAEYEP